jgi:hypothetical protein
MNIQMDPLLNSSIKLKSVLRRASGDPLENLHGALGHHETQFMESYNMKTEVIS